MTFSGIYFIKLKHTNRFYIGSATYMKKRLYEHKRILNHNKHFNPKLQNAWNKYGEKKFIFGILEKCPACKLIQQEQYWIDKLHTIKKGFNINPFANRSKPMNLETRRKISKSHLGRKFSKIHCKNISIARKGKKASVATRHLLSTLHQGENNSNSKYTSEFVSWLRKKRTWLRGELIAFSILSGISESYLSRLASGRNWKCLDK